MTITVHDVCDYTIVKCSDAGEPLSALKLQKLVYYAQAWYLAFAGVPLFHGTFEAWVHGPVSRALYDRFRETKSLYSEMSLADLQPGFNPATLPEHVRTHINNVLESYAKLSGSQLEELTHREQPWVEARGNCPPSARCETAISDTTMRDYYRQRMS